MAVPIEELAQRWLQIDRDPTTREEITQLLRENNIAELENRLRSRISFGTAGLRGRMSAGFSRMNSVTVIQASQGLASYLLKHIPRAKHRGVVIGRDARHNSEKFAQLTAAAFVSKGIKVWWYEVPVHTPLVPFGLRELGACAGVMITASHNPPQDNGYKVYWENGCQIVPPHDAGIAAEIEQNLELVSWDKRVAAHSLLVESTVSNVREKYTQALKDAIDPNEKLAGMVDNSLRFAYTAMHGVGLRAMEETVKILGIEHLMSVVQEQAHPDPDFPGLQFPNPEEKGAMDVAIWSADRHGASLIVANDPDADRLAIAEKVDGKWYQFTGNQLGILLASHIFDTYNGDKKKLAMLASTVSSSMLATMAQKEGFHFEETLTGFKWMGNRAMSLNSEGYDVRFAFEESIGYMVPSLVFDKDGIVSAALFIQAAAQWRKEHGRSPYQTLQYLYGKYGFFEDAPTYVVSPDPVVTKKLFDGIRALGDPHPKKLGSHKITKWRDLTIGWDSSTHDHSPLLPVDASSQMITFGLENGVRATVRASGTEPKIKLYIEAHAQYQEQARKTADETLKLVLNEWLKPRDNGLKLAGE